MTADDYADADADVAASSAADHADAAADDLMPGRLLVACEKLYGGGRGVERFARSGLRYVRLANGMILIEQNPKKRSEWGALARAGRRVAWVMRNGSYLARIVDGEVSMLD